MARLVVHSELIDDFEELAALCPFGAIVMGPKGATVDERCRMCLVCTKRSEGRITLEEDAKGPAEGWDGIAVFAETEGGRLHPVGLELLGKAAEMAARSRQKVLAVAVGHGLEDAAEELRHYGTARVVLYDDPAFADYRVDSYTSALFDFVRIYRPGTVLVGATPLGRSLAPRLAARLRTGLTADCTVLDMLEDGSLIQTRPAFGGNIMATIRTPAHRPQMATVRYKVMDMPARRAKATGEIIRASVTDRMRGSGIEVLEVRPKEKVVDLTEADAIVVAGRGLKSQADMALIGRLADALNAQVAATRPLIEAGWQDPRRQIGLSGRTVKPRLIITCGVSGSVQFAAGMRGSGKIVAINSDANASIFDIAHLGIVGDLYEVVPRLTDMIEDGRAI
ncbi:MAG TPA: electron transfer flavoprotein subunit alpha/FixB family protein [Bacillota bacterium]|mgnify:FL=1|nr:electron transfer flavoprotein subunit alpha/FixB family protein [Bacillota bacterium]HOH09589.1 electron transfer flavoprotein subunit alpha/FixB family protein [Bacillota bacterium]HOS50300.1 electron transfer flavoprotein subunit alpha/FixB family protein [Bacillota bacterium]HQJ23964.1 electron transfer flavoprotein subunit alpha/FixB family protein [Bacillota bacterium]